ncbi:hypothetical protein Smp_126470 [Schistosoma mansoni]|uniref:hypothetical protein n=1 Tax=Schistosoma mansoni TaxID=6183 RepID=UPI0001A642A9|nr:hypothetical protein Smp_126470 [Schistosoma mansoni]|eukprot:XP_018653679.1 hypothetical protein Smp_126470 [Schistosoma mansoni]
MTNKVSELLPFDSRQIICELKEYNIQLKLLFLRLNSCLFIWLGNEESKLSGNHQFSSLIYQSLFFIGLSVCLPSQISTSNQHSTTIYSVTGASRNPFSEYEENLSCKISKRFHCPIFVSISLPYEFAPLWNNINVITQSTLGQKMLQELWISPVSANYSNVIRIHMKQDPDFGILKPLNSLVIHG